MQANFYSQETSSRGRNPTASLETKQEIIIISRENYGLKDAQIIALVTLHCTKD
jgi:hypothetical protein